MGFEIISQELVRRIDSRAAKELGAHRRDAIGDPGTGLWFQRELEYIYAEILKAKHPPLNAMQLFEVDTEVPPGAESYTQYLLEELGAADWVSNFAQDLPSADVSKIKTTRYCKTMGASYTYSLEDMWRSQMNGFALSTEKGLAARLAIEKKLNTSYWNGDTSVKLYGILNYPWTPRYNFSNAIANGTSADTIISELSSWVESIPEATGDAEFPDTMVLPGREYSHISNTPRASTSDTTIKEFFLNNNDYITKIERARECRGAGPSGVNVGVCYKRGDKRQAKLVLSLPFTQLPVQEDNLAFKINCLARSGGFSSMYPLGMSIAEFVTPS